MIPVAPAAEPDSFEEAVRVPGRRALLELSGDPAAPPRRGRGRPHSPVAARIADIPSEKLPPHWTHCLPELRLAYRDTCAYLGMKIHKATGAATVDHFLPKHRHPKQAYEWSNYRLASKQVNTNKGLHEDVLDPFLIQDGWFVLNVGTFEVAPAAELDDAMRAKVQTTIDRLKLNEPTFCLARAEYHDRYHGLAGPVGNRPQEPLPLCWLEEECPFVAAELKRQARLRPSPS